MKKFALVIAVVCAAFVAGCGGSKPSQTPAVPVGPTGPTAGTVYTPKDANRDTKNYHRDNQRATATQGELLTALVSTQAKLVTVAPSKLKTVDRVIAIVKKSAPGFDVVDDSVTTQTHVLAVSISGDEIKVYGVDSTGQSAYFSYNPDTQELKKSY